MSAFRKGDTVVHPEHGAAVIAELKDKEFLGAVSYTHLTLPTTPYV